MERAVLTGADDPRGCGRGVACVGSRSIRPRNWSSSPAA